MPLNYTLSSLLEAARSKDDADTKPDETDASQDTPETTDTETQEQDTNQDDNTENNDDNQDDTEDDTDEKKDGEDNPDDTSDDMSDDFSMGTDDGDDEPPPDGLVDPDDDGSGDDMDSETETNVQTQILQLSKLDRTLAKRKVFSNFQELRTSITTVKNLVDNNEAVIEPEKRETIIAELDKLYTYVTDYLTIKFSITSFEENLQNYMLFIQTLNNITIRITDEENPSDKKNKRKMQKS